MEGSKEQGGGSHASGQQDKGRSSLIPRQRGVQAMGGGVRAWGPSMADPLVEMRDGAPASSHNRARCSASARGLINARSRPSAGKSWLLEQR